MMLDCCRTCMSGTSLNPIFQYNDKSQQYTDILAITTGLKIQMNDSLPQLICTNCVTFINQHHDFRETCLKTQKTLIKFVNNINVTEQYKNVTLKCEIDTKSKDVLVKNDFDLINDNLDSNNDSSVSNNDNLVSGEKKESISNKGREFGASTEVLLKEKDNSNNKCNKNKTRSNKLERRDSDTVSKEIDREKERRDVEIKCKFCKKEFKSLQSLRVHLITHTGRNIVCEHCGKKFVSKRRLLMHCKAKHGYEKTDKCSYCDYRGCNPEAVKIHERLHTGEKPYICQECGAGFHRCSTYHQHVPMHLTEKTIQCDQCPALFKSVTLMKIHKNRHKNKRKSRAKVSAEMKYLI